VFTVNLDAFVQLLDGFIEVVRLTQRECPRVLLVAVGFPLHDFHEQLFIRLLHNGQVFGDGDVDHVASLEGFQFRVFAEFQAVVYIGESAVEVGLHKEHL